MRATIHTPRLTLRRFRASDREVCAALLNDVAAARMMARIPHPYTPADFDAWQAGHDGAWEAGLDYPYAVDHAGHGLIGCVGLAKFDVADAHYELGYWMGAPFRGYGFAQEAGAAAIATIATDRGEKTLTSRHFIDNPASARVLARLGFAYTGEEVDADCLARGEKVRARMMRRVAGGEENP